MKIAIDARFVGPQGTGLGKYTEKLIENLQKIDSKNKYAIFLRKENWDYLKITSKNFQKVPADIKWYSFSEQLEIPRIIHTSNPDVVHIPHFNVPVNISKPFIVTIHDLIHHNFTQDSVTTRNPVIYKLKRAAYKFTIARAVNKSQKIIVPSNFVEHEIVKTFKISREKIVVTHEAAEEDYFNIKRLSAPKPYIIYVGNAYPHKNIHKLIDSLTYLKNLDLVLVCPRDVFWQRLKDYIEQKGMSNRVTVHGYLETHKLTKLFGRAKAYVFPSLAEGFGIPGLNAMAAGLPLIASDIPVFREIYGNAAYYFDPQDTQDIAAKIKLVTKNKNLLQDLTQKEKNQAAKYSWQKMAEQTLSIYENCLFKKV